MSRSSIALAPFPAPAMPKTPAEGNTTHPDTLRLHGLAENALATALHCLRAVDCSPAKLRLATARAVRAATLLKRASEAASQACEVKA